ncbi:tRNA pseudouridine synthase B [Pilaira anomala]|nr:tRNA pseudouridine synthase B [Pilaira anomala]
MAEGVLVIGVGKSCKELPNYLSGTKEYLVQAKLGQATDTFDAMGEVTKTKDTSHITEELLNKTLPSFTGNITQVPPIYSALKIQGKRLYDYARRDIELPEPIKARNVYIEQLSLISLNQDMIELKVICGGGTYMRSLVHDLSISMGTCGHMTALKRTRQGIFHLSDALLLDDTLSKKIIIKGE